MEVEEILGRFSKQTADIEHLDFRGNEIIKSNVIRHDIEIIDPEYAQRLMNGPVYGLLYPTKDNRLVIYIDNKQDSVNFLCTLLHELTHYSDYSNFATIHTVPFRELLDDFYFVLWSEFHASYISYRFAIRLGKDYIMADDTIEELIGKYRNYVSGKKQIQLSEYANFCFRLYGEIFALSDEFSDEAAIARAFEVVPDRFSSIFDFLLYHKTYASLIESYNEYKSLIDTADN